MRIKSLKAQLIYRVLLTIVGVIATVMTFTNHIVSLGGDGTPTALYFTTWSVWFATLTAITSLISTVSQLKAGKTEGYNKLIPMLKFCSMIMIIATFIVAAFVLPTKIFSAGYWTAPSIFKHFLLPIMTVLDCILFDPRNHMSVVYPFAACVAPLIYWIVVIARFLSYRASCGGMIPEAEQVNYYPYGFTNLDAGHSLGGLIGLLAGILVGLIVIGFIFWLCDKLHRENGKTVFDAKVEK